MSEPPSIDLTTLTSRARAAGARRAPPSAISEVVVDLVRAVSDISLRLAALEAAIESAGGEGTFLEEANSSGEVPLVEAVPAADVRPPVAHRSSPPTADKDGPPVVAVAGAKPESAAAPQLMSGPLASTVEGAGAVQVGAVKYVVDPSEAVLSPELQKFDEMVAQAAKSKSAAAERFLSYTNKDAAILAQMRLALIEQRGQRADASRS